MRITSRHGIKSLALLATLLTIQHALADDGWKPAAALLEKDQEGRILKKVSVDRGNVINVDYVVPAPTFERHPDQTYRGENTERCILGNAWLYGKPGEPLLPYITAKMFLPYGHTVKKVSAVPTDSRRVKGSHLLSYGEKPVPLSAKTVTRTPAKEVLYESSEIYPGNTTELVSINDRCGVSIATIHICPVQYSPNDRAVSYWKTFRLEVETEPQRTTNANGIRIRLDRFEENGLTEENPETLKTYPDKTLASASDEREATESYSFVIVSNKAIINATTTPNMNDYVAHKTRMGQTCKVEAIEDILKNYTGATDSDKLRNYLRNAYNKWNTKFVLLGGDTNIIPLRTVSASNENYTDNLPSDMPYQCLSQETWDNDYEAEVYIGRASAQDATEFSNFIYKTITFETSDPNDPYLKAELGGGEVLDETTQAKPSMQELQKIFPTNWTFGGIYDVDGTWSSDSEIINQVNSNKYSIIDHLGHSDVDYVMKVGSSSAWNTSSPLTNTKFFFVKSQGCIPGAFDRDCAAEHWTTSSRTGAWGVVLNSRYGWFEPGKPTEGSSHYVHRAFWNAYWKENLKTVGQCNEYSHRMNTSPSCRWDILESNLFGDPTVSFGLMPTPPNGPKANFTFTQNNGNAITFTDTSTCSVGVINAWAWDFGDGTTSKDKNPAHTYAQTGTYNVKLTVTADNAKTSTITKTVQLSGTSYALIVTSGSGNGTYQPGAKVTITANAAPSGKTFDKWVVTSGSPAITNVNAATTTLTMSANAATVMATYVNTNGGPAGYTWCAKENGSYTFTTAVDLAYGANGKFNYKSGVTGTITFNNATFGDPIVGVVKAGYYKASSTPTYALTVNCGSGSGTYKSGATVTITANAAPANFTFDSWLAMSGSPVIANLKATTTTLTMPTNAATVLATYRVIPGTTFPLTVNSGSGSGKYEAYSEVTITANAAPAGKIFDKWVVTSGSPAIANVYAATTTLWVGCDAVTVTATYRPVTNTYALTVNSGSGSGNYLSGAVITITANAAPSGMTFDKWVVTSGSPTITNVNAATTTLTMSAGTVTVKATYRTVTNTYALTVSSGSGSGNYLSGAAITITANAAPSGMTFDKWVVTSGSPTITNVNAATTTLTMSAGTVTVKATYRTVTNTYALTVSSGSGSGNYLSGAVVTIMANAAPAGKTFDKWVVTSGSSVIANVNAATTTLTMSASAATVTATYRTVTNTYALTVSSGSGSGNYASGATVTITANAAPAGKTFDKWVVTSGSSVIANVNAATTTLTMSAGAVTVTATYRTVTSTYTLTVSSGSGSGNYLSGATVTISANAAPAGKTFDKWVVTSGSSVIANVNAATTTLTMPAGAVMVTATYRTVTNTYQLTVSSGSGSGNYLSGATVIITANAAPAGKTFDKWVVTSGSSVIANVNAATTTLTMPAGAVTVTATYRTVTNTYQLTVSSGSGSGNYLSGSTITIMANAAPSGQVFSQWVATSGSPVIANVNAATTTLTMPTSAATVTATYKPSGSPSNSLVTNGTLISSQTLRSSNGLFVFILQSNGTMVLYNSSWRPIWSSNTAGGGVKLVLESDGDLVLYTSSNTAVWSSNTAGSGADLLRLNDKGSLVLYKGSTVVKALVGTP